MLTQRREWRRDRRRTRESTSDRALALHEKGIDTTTICERLGVGLHSVHSMMRCARSKRERWRESR